MDRRDVLRLLLAAPPQLLDAAPCQSVLDPRTAADYEAYLKTARTAIEQPLNGKLLERVPEPRRAEAMKILDSNKAYIWNLHEHALNGALPVYKGVIVDWMGAMRIPDLSLETFQKVLQDFNAYKKWYSPYIYDCFAHPTAGPGVQNFAVTSILHDVYEKPAPLVPDQHFSFEIQAESNYFLMGSPDDRTLVIRTHAKSIREAGSGHPEHADSRTTNDLLPAGRGQGVLWKSDTWWRASQTGSGVYAEYESLSLARSLDAVEFFSLCSVLRLPGLKEKALDSMTVRPRKTVTAIMQGTRRACENAAAAPPDNPA
ncbi:MAG TPA: hypothetical protein VGL72_29870 [Bryobacteraceae bacterium]|jgi:hypothetical protein